MPSGSHEVIDKMLYIDDNGNERLRPCGITDTYALIQSYRESCDLAYILRNLDPNSLNNAVSTFNVKELLNSPLVDISSMPKSLGELYNLIREGDNLFNGLPEMIRSEFNYSVKNFVSSFGTQRFADVLNKYSSFVQSSSNLKPDGNLKPEGNIKPEGNPKPEGNSKSEGGNK